MEWQDEVDELEKHVDNGVVKQEGLIKEASSTLQKYISEELKKDIPTGLIDAYRISSNSFRPRSVAALE